ncbi:MAG: hypothetical protein IPK08_17490 [Bacteroidetes bacterium]|nr:hypothetical protein [Bacteroidota bacterium]
MKKYLLLTALSFAVITSSIAQTGSKYGTDSVTCITNISLFNEYFKQNNFVDALEPWRWVFSNCPAATKELI